MPNTVNFLELLQAPEGYIALRPGGRPGRFEDDFPQAWERDDTIESGGPAQDHVWDTREEEDERDTRSASIRTSLFDGDFSRTPPAIDANTSDDTGTLRPEGETAEGTAGMEAKDDFERVRALVASLPREAQLAIVEEFAARSAPRRKPDISGVPLWGGKKKDGPAIAWLENHYGEHLRTFGAPENRLYRQDIEKHDEKLLHGVEREAYASGKKPRDFLPTKSDAIDDTAKTLGFDEQGRALTGPAKEVHKTAGVLRSRKFRQKQSQEPPPNTP